MIVLLALVAFTSARTPTTHQIANKQDVTMAKIFKIMETISHINWKLIDHEKLANKYVSVNGKDVEIARFVQILERTSKINWKLIGSLFEQKKISLHQQATVNGQQINLSIMLKALESVCEIDWTQFVSTAGKNTLSRLFLIFLNLRKYLK